MTQSEIEQAVREGALRRLGVLAADEGPTAADDALAAETLTRVVDDLAARDEVWFTAGDLPEEARHALILLVADDMGAAFGLTEERLARLKGEATEARRTMRAMGRAASRDTVPFINY